MKRAVMFVVLVVVAFAAGLATKGHGSHSTGVDTVRVLPQEYRARLAELAIERDGLRARLEGVSEREPEVIVRTDSVLVTDTVFVVINARGRLTYQLATSL